MRFDTKAFFIKENERTYDEKTGNYNDGEIVKDLVYCSKSPTEEKKMMIVYGKLNENSLTIVLQNHYTKDFDCIEIDNKKYTVDSSKKLRNKHIFVISQKL